MFVTNNLKLALTTYRQVLLLLLAFIFVIPATKSQTVNELLERNLSTKDLVMSVQYAVLYNYNDYLERDYLRKGFQNAGWLYSHFFDENKNVFFFNKAKELAESGNQVAQMMLGLLYFGGLGTAQSMPAAKHWWQESASSGFPESFYLLGAMSLIEGNNKEAANYFKISAELGYPDAMLITALNYYHGYGGFNRSNARFYLWAKQAQILGANLIDKIKLRWPLDREPLPYLDINLILTMAESNSTSSDYDAAYRQIANEVLLSYSEHCFTDSKTQLLIPESLSSMIYASAVLRVVMGKQGTMRSLKEQPESESASTLAGMFAKRPAGQFDLIYHEKYDPETSEALTLPFDLLVQRLCPSTAILLSDRVTHHYTIVYSVDIQHDAVYIADGWPEDFFLLKENNAMLIAGKLVPQPHGRFLVQLTLKDLQKTLVGAIVQKH